MAADTTANDKAKQAIAQVAVSKQQTRPRSIITDLVAPAMKRQIEMALPAHLQNNADRYVRCYLTLVRTNPKLLECSRESLLGAMMTGAAFGLDPSPSLGEMYLIPYKDECAFILGYKGMTALAYRAGVKKIWGHEVCENDDFSLTWGLKETMVHRPKIGDRGKTTGYYVAAVLSTGATVYNYMTKDEVLKHCRRYSPSFQKSSSPWNSDFDSMALKTCMRGLFRWLPKSTEIAHALAKDDSVVNIKEAEQLDSSQVLDVEEVHPEIEEGPESEEQKGGE